jgi:hypothetical protein
LSAPTCSLLRVPVPDIETCRAVNLLTDRTVETTSA